MDKIDLKELQLFLNNNQGKIPKSSKSIKTLFDVMKQPHLENVWSNIYAFFFNPEEDHGFGNLFLRTLVELIKEKQYGRDFTEMIDEYIDVKTEDSTEDSKRLDVALQSDNCAILIENKVYADLYNNLGVYWRNYPQYDENHKQGVVLSLYPKTISLEGRGKELDHDPKKWVNITHLELMERVNKNIPQLEPNKYHLLCEEFYTNI
ncbi:MAG: PD-(D/E)XK nuclease family protein, partial [Rikenellaceae bacterium]